MIQIAIDGPGGAGKSTISRAVAAKLGIVYVDTGALYRTIGYYVHEKNTDPKDAEAVEKLLPEIRIELKYEDGKQIVLLNGEDLGDKIRTPEMSMYASAVSTIPAVRSFLLDTQREIAKKNSVIMDGRDIGTVVLPKANVKIFLTASAEVRAKRRTDELVAKGQKANYSQILKEIQQRDYQDTHREVAPLKMSRDSIKVDTSEMDIDQVVAEIKTIVGKKIPV